MKQTNTSDSILIKNRCDVTEIWIYFILLGLRTNMRSKEFDKEVGKFWE